MNQQRNIVIIGCGAGGGTAAQFARKTDRKASITVFEQGAYPQYSKCGLPYVISGRIPNSTDLIEFSEEWFNKAAITLMLHTTVEEIDGVNKVVKANQGNKSIEQPYSSLIIATGAHPSVPPIRHLPTEKHEVEGVFCLRTLDDANRIIDALTKKTYATIVGAGLIGMEMADCLHSRGMKVTIVEALPQIVSTVLDKDMSQPIQDALKDKIDLFTNHFATSIDQQKGKITHLTISNGETGEEQKIKTDLLIIATGTTPETVLAERLGCTLGKTGGIKINEKAETSIPDVYGVGDCTEYHDFVTKRSILTGLGSIVVRQGITAGINAAGGSYTLPPGVLLTSTSEFFGMEIASVGPTSQHLDDAQSIGGKFTGSSLPEYVPGGKPITMKILIDKKDGCVLGAQAVGSNAALRINTMACAILNRMTVESLRKLETAYAPPIAPTLDVTTLVCDVVAMKYNRMKRSL
jgi:NADH oxidase (H2O2-forming)